jgi:hypothetical protein
MPDYFVTAISYRDDTASCHRPASSEFRSREPTVADARRDENCVVRRAKLVALPKSVDVFTQHLDRTCSELRLVEMKTSFENTTDSAQRSGSDDSLGRGTDTQQQVDFASRSAQRTRDVAVANQL